MDETKRETIIEDDFYENPDEVRRRALEHNFSVHEWRPRICIWPEAFTLNKREVGALMDRFTDMIGEELEYDPAKQGFFRLLSHALYIQLTRQDIVVHTDNYDWSGIICMSPGYTGTMPLYRHLPSGRTALAGNHEWTKELSNDSVNMDAWRLVDEISLAYNRLILFNPRQFHYIAPGCGGDKTTARLTQQFQFNQTRKALSTLRVTGTW